MAKPSNQAAEQQFLDLLAKHQGIPLKIARCYSGNAQDRDDIVQEIHAQLWRSFPKYDASRAFSTWMYRVALNVAISSLRRSTKQDRTVSLEGESIVVTAPEVKQPDARVAALTRFIATLDPLNRALLLLYLDDQSHRDIAEILGISASNVGTRMGRLKKRIRDEIEDHLPKLEAPRHGTG